MCRRKPETESHEFSDLCDPEDPGSRPHSETVHLGTQCRQPPLLAEPAGGLLQTPMSGSCSPWSLGTALGTRVACECVRAGGGGSILGGEGVSCPQSIVLG